MVEEQLKEKQVKQQEESKPEQSESKKSLNGMLGGWFCGGVLSVIAFLIYQIYHVLFFKLLFWVIIFLDFICILVAISCFFDWKTAIKMERLEEEARKEEQEYADLDHEKKDIRAEKQFKMNQKELMRYYDMNLAQTKFLSGLGIVLILAGLIMNGVSIGAYIFVDIDKILLIVGNVSGIIVDFVGVVFIRMYTQNIKAAVKFHAKLADSNNLLLANSIAHKIENKELRENTLSDLAKEIVSINREINK